MSRRPFRGRPLRGATTAGAGAAPAPAAAAAQRRDPLPLRLAAFAALALFGAAHWQTLVADPSTGRTLLVVAVATAGGALLALLGRLAAAPARRCDWALAPGVHPRERSH